MTPTRDEIDALLSDISVGDWSDGTPDGTRAWADEMMSRAATMLRALRAALQDAEVGELKNALAVGQACIELQEERNLNQRAYIEMAELRAALAESDARCDRLAADVNTAWSAERDVKMRLAAFVSAATALTSRSNPEGGFTVLTVDLDELAAMAAQEKANG